MSRPTKMALASSILSMLLTSPLYFDSVFTSYRSLATTSVLLGLLALLLYYPALLIACTTVSSKDRYWIGLSVVPAVLAGSKFCWEIYELSLVIFRSN